MSGVRRIIVGEITHSSVRGKALADALASELTSEEAATSAMKRKIDQPTKKMKYGKKK